MNGRPTADIVAENERLRLAILDIDAHATPLGEDDEGFVSVGYAISVGCLHRALGLVGYTAPKGVTRVDLEADFITMLYDLVPQEVGVPIGTAALIWRAARELEAIANALPPCPTCGGKGMVARNFSDTPCPDCSDGQHPGDGKVPIERLVKVFEAVFSDEPLTIYPKSSGLSGVIDATLAVLRRAE